MKDSDIKTIYKNQKNILLVGTYPPPLGGISVFMYRLEKLLVKNNYNVKVYNTAIQYGLWGRKYINFVFYIIKESIDVVHIQHFDIKKVIALLLLRPFKKFKIYYTDHNSFQFDNKKGVSLSFFNWLIAKIDFLIVVNSHILENYKKFVPRLPENIMVCNAFLPPPLEDKQKILATYPPSLIDYLNNRKPIIIANAYQLKFIDGIDLYGLDLVIELTKRLIVDFPKIGFLFCLANENISVDALDNYKKTIEQNKIDGNFLFLTGQRELWPLFEHSDLFIRPTYRDGYPLSIEEALYFNCPTLASDACERPSKTVVFRNRDIEDLYAKSTAILSHTYK